MAITTSVEVIANTRELEDIFIDGHPTPDVSLTGRAQVSCVVLL